MAIGQPNYNGKIVLITGSNRGIGKEIGIQLLEKGFRVIFTSRKEWNKEDQQESDRAWFYEIDVTKRSLITKAREKCEEDFGKLDVLINNAGILGPAAGPAKTSVDELEQVMNTNFLGPYRMLSAFLPLLKRSNDARVINISSGMGAHNNLLRSYAAYRLSKNALNAQTRIWANELREQKIKVFAMSPGWVKTEMGGSSAPRSVAKGAETAVFLSVADDVVTGSFYQDSQIISW